MNTPTTLDEMFPSKYLKAADIHGEQVVTIKKFDQEELPNRETQKDELKVILYFEEFEKGMVLNKTNKKVIESMYGTVIEDLKGKRVILHTQIVESYGESVPAIRIKAQKPPADRAVLLAHYSSLCATAKKLGVEVDDYQVSDKMTDQEIIELGKELKNKVDAAKAFE